MEEHEQKNNNPIEQNQTEEKLTQTVNTVEIHMSREDAPHIARDAQGMGRQTILRRYVKAREDRPPEMTVDGELFMTHAKTRKM